MATCTADTEYGRGSQSAVQTLDKQLNQMAQALQCDSGYSDDICVDVWC